MPPNETNSVLCPDVPGLFPIALETLCPVAALDFNLYLRSDSASPAVLYRERSFPLTPSDLDRLQSTGVGTLYISVADHGRYRHYLFHEVIQNEKVAPARRHQILVRLHRRTFETAFRSHTPEKIVQFAAAFAPHLINIVCHTDFVLRDVFRLMKHDYYTYTHAVNVCTYCLALANALHVNSKPDLTSISIGALLHDLGKRCISQSVLNKPGRLNKEEWKLVEQHPQKGFEDLCFRADLTWGQLMMVYQHHERVDGQGYPVQHRGEDIHEWARLCTVADVFDALTSERPYRKAMPLKEALKLLEKDAGTAFDKEMVECWIATVRAPR